MDNQLQTQHMAHTKKKGARRIVTPAWRSAALAAMESGKRTRRDVADAVGISAAYLTMLVNGRYVSSSHLDAVSEELGIDTVESQASTPVVQEITERANRMSEKMLRSLLVVMDAMDSSDDPTKH